MYAFTRRIDDIGHSDLPTERNLAPLDAARKPSHELQPGTQGESDDAVLVALADMGY